MPQWPNLQVDGDYNSATHQAVAPEPPDRISENVAALRQHIASLNIIRQRFEGIFGPITPSGRENLEGDEPRGSIGELEAAIKELAAAVADFHALMERT